MASSHVIVTIRAVFFHARPCLYPYLLFLFVVMCDCVMDPCFFFLMCCYDVNCIRGEKHIAKLVRGLLGKR